MKKGSFLFLVFILLSLFLTACGGGSSPTNVTVTLTDFAYSPNTITVPTGKEITVKLINKGVPHDFTIVSTPVSGTYDPTKTKIIFQLPVDGVSNATGKFVAPAPGTYQILCTKPGHFEEGMTATLVVTP
jgi:plastocyanin